MKRLVQWFLAKLARLILNKYKPDVIGVTGSFGKTSAKEAIFTVLSGKFNVRKNIKNYNNEIGLPLTIIGVGSGGRSVWAWLGVFIKAFILLIWREKNYPEILVLEMAVDHPGDMSYLTGLAPCKIGVVTGVGPVHIEFFKTIERIAKEKSVMVSHIDKNGWAILNCDNEYVCEMDKLTRARLLTYGISNNEVDIKASEISMSQHEDGKISGLSFKLFYQGSSVPVLLPNILGEHLIYAALAAAAVGRVYDINMVDIADSLRAFKAPKGRMNLIDGIKNTHIIDDTYNAGPDSTVAALNVLGKITTESRKFAVLGDMLELGDYTESSHREVGKAVFNNHIDYLITVGERAELIASEAQKQGLDQDNIFIFSETEKAGLFLQDKIETGDFILVKGSQGMRMEKIVKEIIAEPLKAGELLVRQDDEWL
ncbi:MAG: Mur ligase family protein [Candidatus Buchananbacteria bacterium]|nr:Mur ligase family protein [Candidatus Buchananbacteria bacterium]